MTTSIQQMLANDWGSTGHQKTASVQHSGGDDVLDKLAAEMGIDFGDDTDLSGATETNYNQEGSQKIASADLMDGIDFNDFFEDDLNFGTEKTAQEKFASADEVLGALSYDHFSDRFEKRIEKIAMNAVVASKTSDNPHENSVFPIQQPNNKPANANQAIDSTSIFTDNQLPPQSGNHISGTESQGIDATQKTAQVHAAMRKHLLTQLIG